MTGLPPTKREGKRPLGGPRGRWKDYIETDLREILSCLSRIHLAQSEVKV
jgi:hypothetical protein